MLPWLMLMIHSHMGNLCLQLVFATLSWSIMTTLSFLEFTEEDCFGHAYTWLGQPSTTAPEARWTLCWAGWRSWGLLYMTCTDVALPFDAKIKNGAQAVLVKSLKLDLLPVDNPGLCITQGGWNDHSCLPNLHGDVEWMTLSYSLWPSSKGTASFGQVVVKIFADCGIIELPR